MSDMETDCLRLVRIFGPCSNADIGRRLGVAPDKTYRAIKRLEASGLVAHPKKQQWEISALGLGHFAFAPSQPLALAQTE